MRQAITWINIDQYGKRYMVTLGHIELMKLMCDNEAVTSMVIVFLLYENG